MLVLSRGQTEKIVFPNLNITVRSPPFQGTMSGWASMLPKTYVYYDTRLPIVKAGSASAKRRPNQSTHLPIG